MRLHWGEIKSGYDIVIVARPSAKDSDYGKFESAIFHFVEFYIILLKRRRFGMKIILIKIIRFLSEISVSSQKEERPVYIHRPARSMR